MEIISIRTEKMFAAPGVKAFEGEIKTWDQEEGVPLYISCSFYEGVHMSVSRQSVLDFMMADNADELPEIEFLEQYESLSEAVVSDYIDGFVLLNNLLNEMIDLNFDRRKCIYNYIVSPIELMWGEGDFPQETLVTGEFQYKTKSMRAPVQRKGVVRITDGIVTCCAMEDGEGTVLEAFDDIEAAERSKWLLLYQYLIEQAEEEGFLSD